MESNMVKNSDSRFPLWFVLNVPFTVMLLVSSGLIGYLGFHNGSNTAQDLARQLLTESSTRVQQNLDSLFNTAQRLNAQNIASFRLNQLDLNDLLSTQQHLLAGLQTYEEIQAVGFGSEKGEFVAAFRSILGVGFVVSEASARTNFAELGYETNSLGERGKLLVTIPDYDPRTKSWYQLAAQSRGAVWTPVYTWINQISIAIDVVAPVYDESGSLLGVFDVSLNPASISQYLQDLSLGRKIDVFIVDDAGLLVASSTMPQPFAHINDTFQRFDPLTISDALIQSAARQVTDQFGGWSGIESNQQFAFTQAGEKSLAQVIPYDGLGRRWWIVVAIPESTYMASINENIGRTLLLIGVALMLSVGLLTWVSWRITRPVLQLSQAAKAIAAGNWSQRATVNRRDELGEMGASFNQMAEQLQQSTISMQASEARFRTTFERAEVGIAQVAPDGQFLLINDYFCDLLGYTRDELLAKTFRDITHPEDVQADVDLRQQILARRIDHYTLEKRYLRRDQTLQWVNLTVSMIWNDDDSPRHFISVIKDITERKQAEAALQTAHDTLEERVIQRTAQLQAAKERVEAILNSSVDGILLIQPDFTIERTNPAFDQLFKCEINAYLHRSFKELLLPETDDLTFMSIQSQVVGKQNLYREIHARRHDGSVFDAEISIGSIKAEGFVCIIRDITERKLAEKALRQALATEKELGELKSRFVSMASHEFRTPLATILAVTETLSTYRHKLTNEQIDKKLNNILEQVEYLKNIMDDVLLLARMQARRMEFNPEKVNLDALCQSILHEFKSRPDVRHTLAYICDTGIDEGMLDRRLLHQVISNLLSNAIKYSPEDQPIQMSLSMTDTHYILSVQDYGIGIPEADLKYLFAPFHRASNVGTISGTGLGLVIVKDIVELHGGTISVESVPDKGSKFTVFLLRTTEDVESAKNSSQD
jgi:PAS domain S-box-containing protein